MPELPEVEVLVRHLAPLIHGKTISNVQVRRERILGPTSLADFKRTLQGATFLNVSRRGKYLLFNLRPAKDRQTVTLVGHLGMTGRMYLLRKNQPLPKHAAVVLGLGRENFVFEDTRYFGKFTLDTRAIAALSPEPLGDNFLLEGFAAALKRSSQAIKVKLLDQRIAAGLGNIYASEALFRARISPRTAARRLSLAKLTELRRAIREVLTEAIRRGSTVPLNYAGSGERDGLFYFGRAPGASESYEERLRVYDRAGDPCRVCGTKIRRLIQAARSTFYCPHCQR